MRIITRKNTKSYPFLVLLIFVFCYNNTISQTKTKISEKNKKGVILKIDDSNEAANYRMGEDFPSGTIFKTSNSSVILEANKNEQELQPNTRHKIIFDGVKETHITYKGKVKHFVNNNESEYTISGNHIKIKSITTIFEVEVNKKQVIVKSVEGKVNIFQKIPIKIKSSNTKSNTKGNFSKTNFKSAIDGEILIFERYPDPYSEEFTTNDALDFFIDELESHEDSNFPFEQLADDNNLIGELYLDLNQADEAIPYFDEALNYYRGIDFFEQELAEVYLNLTEAYSSIDNQYTNVKKYGDLAIKLLNDEIIFDLEDLDYAYEDGNYDLVKMINENLNYNYWNLGWVYEITNRQSLANENYEISKEYE